MTLRHSALALLFLVPRFILAQEQLGMRMERYSGIYSTTINPGNTAYNPNNWELSLFTGELFFENNYAYLRNTSLQHALKNTDLIVAVVDTNRENPAPANAIFLDYFDQNRRMHVVLQNRVSGPSFSFRLGEDHVVGLTTAFRSEISSYNIPGILAYRNVSDLPRNQAINIPSTGLTGMVWGEVGLHYSRRYSDGDLQRSWGVSPKWLLGYEGFFVRAQSEFDYTQRLGDTVAFGKADWNYALTLGNVADSDNVRLRRQGGGFGLDAGMTWAQGADDAEDGYQWRLGVSVMDLGWVRFHRNAELHHIAFDTLLTVSDADFPGRDQATEVLNDVSRAFLGNPDASLESRSFSIGLPTALSVQFDAKLSPNFYAAALLVQRVPLFSYSIKRPNTLALAPRFEHRWFSLSAPIVLDDWRSLRVGLGARLAWLYLGSDNLGSFFNKGKLTGGDIYFGLKINAFSLHFNGRERLGRESRSHHGRQKMNKIKCYQF